MSPSTTSQRGKEVDRGQEQPEVQCFNAPCSGQQGVNRGRGRPGWTSAGEREGLCLSTCRHPNKTRAAEYLQKTELLSSPFWGAECPQGVMSTSSGRRPLGCSTWYRAALRRQEIRWREERADGKTGGKDPLCNLPRGPTSSGSLLAHQASKTGALRGQIRSRSRARSQ